MTTLQAAVTAEITKLEAEKADIEAKIETAKGHLVNFAVWAEKEVDAAEAEIKSFFDKFRTTTVAG